MINITGAGTVATYQQALASVQYFNGAEEPSASSLREVEFRVHDGDFFSNVATGFVNITLLDDNPAMLDCGNRMVSFTEDSSTPVPLASFLTLSDRDTDHFFTGASVAITNPQEGDEIVVDGTLSASVRVQLVSTTRIELTGDATGMEYQVRISTPTETVCTCHMSCT